MSKAYKVIYVYTEDWEGIYVDDELQYQGHDTPISAMLNIMDAFKVFDGEHEVYWIDEEDMEELVKLPDSFKDIPKEILVK